MSNLKNAQPDLFGKEETNEPQNKRLLGKYGGKENSTTTTPTMFSDSKIVTNWLISAGLIND